MLAPLILGLAVLAGCSGGEANEPALTPIAGSDSAYCHTEGARARWWRGLRPAQPGGSSQVLERLPHHRGTILQQAPSVIRDEVAVKVSHIRTVLTPLLERYDFDLKRVRREGSAAEQAALFQAPPVETQKAQEAQYAYDDRTCGTAPSPRAADVVFAVSPASTAFCDPDVMRELVTGDGFTEALDGLDAAAPVAIVADVEADTEWFRTRWSDVLARHSYDLRGIYLDGTPDDLAVFNRTHPDVVEHSSRTTAYEEQVCEG